MDPVDIFFICGVVIVSLAVVTEHLLDKSKTYKKHNDEFWGVDDNE